MTGPFVVAAVTAMVSGCATREPVATNLPKVLAVNFTSEPVEAATLAGKRDIHRTGDW